MSDAPDNPKPVKRWPPAVVELGYHLYASSAQQNVSEAARQLSAITKEEVPATTAYDWANAGQWAERYGREKQVAIDVPAMAHVGVLAVAGLTAVRYLSKVAAGHEPYDRDRVAVNQYMESAARSLILAAAKTDGRRKPKPKAADDLPDLTTLSSEDLEALESRLRQQG